MASGYLFNKHTCWKEISFIAREGKKVHCCTALHQGSGAVTVTLQRFAGCSAMLEAVGHQLTKRIALAVQHHSPSNSSEKRYSCNTVGNGLSAVAISEIKLRQ